MADKTNQDSFERSIDRIKEAYHELSNAAGGFSTNQRSKILTICFEAMWGNHGYNKDDLKKILFLDRKF